MGSSMDLKTLLLDAIGSEQPLRCSRRIHLGKQSYAVAFEVKGKMLTITRIKQVTSKNPLHTRLQRRQRLLNKLNGMRSSSESAISQYSLPEVADCATQTSSPHMRSRATETERRGFSVNREQQTARKLIRKQGAQTEPNTVCQQMQTERRATSRSSQTNTCYAHCAAIQTETNNCCVQAQTEQSLESVEREKEAMVFLLSEIGEMIINQNHLLHNNSTMLGQISEMTMLSKVAARQNAAMKCCKRFERQYKMHRYTRKHGRCRFVYIYKKRMPVDKRNQCSQTIYPIGLSSKATQTRKEHKAKKGLKLFCCNTGKT